MRAIRGYEEKDPEITAQMTSGYPRFVVHPLARQLAEIVGKTPRLAGRRLWLTSSERMAAELAAHLGRLGMPAETFADDPVHGVAHADLPEISTQAKLYLQHVGGFISSREAEDILLWRGLSLTANPEKGFPGGVDAAAAEIRRHLLPRLPGATAEDLLLANSGMNAIYAAFRAVSEIQAARGRTGWVQLGWLYRDTIDILRKFAPPGEHAYFADVFDLPGLERWLGEHGSRVAGLATEVPTNPLIQTPDVAALAGLCRRHGVALILDPTVASIYSVNLLPHADVLVTSLTKYTASDGDVIAGLAVVNRDRPDAAELRRRIAHHLEPTYPRDLNRLAAQIGETVGVMARIEASTSRVAAFLAAHPKVRAVYWALHPRSTAEFQKIARQANATGGMISFLLRTPLGPFYDRLRLAKGPSFGMKTTLICPFIYLAHYDLTATEAGRAELAASGLETDLLRLSVGAEPTDEIIAALAEALA